MKRAAAAIACLLAIVAMGLAIVAIERYARYSPQIPFGSSKWQDVTHSEAWSGETIRQHMIEDLVGNVLPGKNRREIEALLGPSLTRRDMWKGKYDGEGPELRVPDFDPAQGECFYDEYDWDMLYPMGIERALVFDHRGQAFSPDPEYLIIRLGADGEFESWWIYGSEKWPSVVGAHGRSTSRRFR